jgi:hypothetical protein
MAETAGQDGKLNVFISYSRDDLKFADQLRAALLGYDFTVTIDRESISPGEDWKQRLGLLIRDADTIVFVLSPSSARSPVFQWEAREAASLNKRRLPILCRPLDDAAAPPELTALQYTHFYEEPKFPGTGFGTGLNSLRLALNAVPEWLLEHTRYLRLAKEWEEAGSLPIAAFSPPQTLRPPRNGLRTSPKRRHRRQGCNSSSSGRAKRRTSVGKASRRSERSNSS